MLKIVSVVSKSKDGQKAQVVVKDDNGQKKTIHVQKQASSGQWFSTAQFEAVVGMPA